MKKRGETRMKNISAVIRDEDAEYIKNLAASLDRTPSWIIRKMIEYAVEHHKKGELNI